MSLDLSRGSGSVDQVPLQVPARDNIPQPTPSPPQSTVIKPTLANLLLSNNIPTTPRPPLTYPNPLDPTVRTLGLASRPSGPGILDTSGCLLTYEHIQAYRMIQFRKPSNMKGKDGKRKISIAEAAWILWAEKGGKWNGGKAGKAGKKGKKGDKEDLADKDGLPGVGLKACNAYRYDENGDPYRPTMSMYEIIRLVLAASFSKQMTLPEIYRAVENRWPYYKTCPDTWKGAIRNNLSVHDCFIQVAQDDKDGKQVKGLWKIDEEIAGPIYPRAKDKEKSTNPILTQLKHHLHPSFESIDPEFQIPSEIDKKRKVNPPDTTRIPPELPNEYPSSYQYPFPIERPVQRNPQGLKYRIQPVSIGGKALDFPLPGVPPHSAGVVPGGYPNPLPRGWMWGWGDPTLVDLGRRYGGLQPSAGIIDELGSCGMEEYRENLPHFTSSASRAVTSGFAPLSDFSSFLTSIPPSQPMSSTSSSSSIASSTFQPTAAFHLPFLNLLLDPLNPNQEFDYHPIPNIPSSSYPVGLLTEHTSAESKPAIVNYHLRTRGEGFVPPETQQNWRRRGGLMDPFPGSGDWVEPRRIRSKEILPGIEEVLGQSLRRGDLRNIIPPSDLILKEKS